MPVYVYGHREDKVWSDNSDLKVLSLDHHNKKLWDVDPWKQVG